ncbi:MAG: hypothetical protein ACTH2Q_00250 [Propionibacteriaceae bacterium]
MDITLLGPQRDPEPARRAVEELMPDGPVATVNAGWQERENDSALLDEVLGGRMHNLELWQRWQQVLAEDSEYTAAERRLTEVLDEIQAVYALRLEHAMAGLAAVGRRTKEPAVRTTAHRDGLRAVQDLDAWLLGSVAETRADFYAGVRLGERESIGRHRAEVAELVRDSVGMVFTGGHVGVLLHVLHVFDLGRLLGPPVIAWSAGAMALSDRVVLFNDQAPYGAGYAEVYAEGMGVFSGVLPFPHPRRRLRLDDPDRVALLADRFAPRQCLLLDRGARVDLQDGRPVPPDAVVLPDTTAPPAGQDGSDG